ncbi:signal peptide peptidase SppA [Planctomicrobium piriforme]|uniref:Protease-4 n=1 Tax=Planctomicrobium piriforme TaxID=1576369 RepID=A0A1I3D659_9PLAN|nr:signal peptide peptidase SppA [Planctomicrobium piriforme]SFH82157.1 protease-4 [Planctomicrobium piriforme]
MTQPAAAAPRQPLPIVIMQPRRRWIVGILLLMLLGSIAVNLLFAVFFADYLAEVQPPYERFHSGNMVAKDKIARLVTDFTIMPPHTHRLIEAIEHVQKKDDIKGVLLVIDSPGGLVSDSHEIYHKLLKLSEKKPIYVTMKGIAASGGYYIAMGAGAAAPIYAEPTTWTGSIGVIMPRYDAVELAHKIGVKADSLVTGPYKDSLNPIKELTPEEKAVWMTIIDDSFQRFLKVIDDSRTNLDMEQIKALATGQVYTANQALANGLVDKIGYEEDALEALKQKLGLTDVRVVNFEFPKSFTETLLGASAQMSQPDPLSRLMEASVPRAMYLFGWPTMPTYFPTR